MRFDVIKHHRWWFTLSSLLVIASLVSIFVRGFNFGIDYTGGTIVEVVFNQPVQVAQVREDLNSSIWKMLSFSYPVKAMKHPVRTLSFVPVTSMRMKAQPLWKA
mgnify:CR=1 FL=1